ncbi:hypothetical protein FRX31_025599 [Thalictrum thalictroides]|uniref:Uncharacterized protein n=1 Tax=Thalictrum thalictroides TaxID=46969 RepID=A0A7J6VI85_THATH|nr:hypothetical protein FRX31_025599 [Thalictrum thalictroides]
MPRSGNCIPKFGYSVEKTLIMFRVLGLCSQLMRLGGIGVRRASLYCGGALKDSLLVVRLITIGLNVALLLRVRNWQDNMA